MKLLFSLIVVWFSGSVGAQEGRSFNQQVWCFDQKAVVEVLSRDYKESAIFYGESDNVQYVLYANAKTGGWTMIAYQDGLGCIMGAGKKHQQIFGTGI